MRSQVHIGPHSGPQRPIYRAGPPYEEPGLVVVEELVVVVTPQVLDDEEGGVFGYGYKPGTSGVRQVLNSYR